MTNICPVCKKDDQIQRVETLVSAGKSSGTFSGPTFAGSYSNGKFIPTGAFSTLRGSTSTDLAKLLEPPQMPPTPKGYGCWWVLIAYPVIPIVGAFFSIPFVIPGGIVMGIASGNSGMGNSPLVGVGIALIAIGEFIGIGLAIRYFIKKNRKMKESKAEKYAIDKSKWDTAIQRWKGLYYCHRDGIVFNPATGETCLPNSITSYIYQQS